jgi:DNA-binding transcriptional regulator YhcF (GntR family)
VITIDRTSPVPLYFQLAQHFEAAIRSGALKVGSRLDNEVQLAERLGLSRPTVRAAFQCLSNKGLVVRSHGAGTLVATERLDRDVKLTSLYDDLAAAGGSPDTKVICNEVTHAVRGEVLLARRHRCRPRAGRRARRPGRPGHRRRPRVTWLGSLLFAADDLVLCPGPDMRRPRPAALRFPPHYPY